MDFASRKPDPTEPPRLADGNTSDRDMPNSLVALIIVNCVSFMLIQVLQVFIVPVVAAMLADFGARPPAFTQLLIDWTGFVKSSS